ncbi:MAG: FAD-binding protein [Victivallales bacterium]|nr:FAD-binding protein [Victivallales bacterium]
MAELIIHPDKITDPAAAMKLCPFGAIVDEAGQLTITAACRMCRLCVRKGPAGAFELREDASPAAGADIGSWHGIAVYVEHEGGKIHPVTLELLGKARELARKSPQPVYALFIGAGSRQAATALLEYGPDEVFVYDHPELTHFRIEPYAAAGADFITRVRPAIILVGGTTVGRSLAPRLAARFRTGLTADCTALDIQPDGGLAQIRPAFGGNIMAHIMTPKRRPQFATVRYKIFPLSEPEARPSGKVTVLPVKPEFLSSAITVLEVKPKPAVNGIEEAEVIVAAGRGLKKAEDLAMIRELAALLHGEVASTRSLIEAGWVDPRRQIGLSGRTVKPRLLIACGISGAIQFVAGMKGSETVIAINSDPEAPIFRTAHYALVGDLYQIVPELINRIKADGAAAFISSGAGVP